MLVCVETRPLMETILELHYVVGVVSGRVNTVSIRSGVNVGEVILMEGDDYVGHCVNVAALAVRPGSGGLRGRPPRRSWVTCPAGALPCRRRTSRCEASRSRCLHRASRWPTGARTAPSTAICGLPLTHDMAEEIAHDVLGLGRAVLLAGLRLTWRRRPARAGGPERPSPAALDPDCAQPHPQPRA